MRNECLNSKYAYTSPMPVSRLVSLIGGSNWIKILMIIYILQLLFLVSIE
jgi:20S proteasome subunit alpha 6